MGHCDMIACNPRCLRCGDTPSCGDGSWGWMDGVHRHRCRDSHPQCGYDRVPCEKHQPEELIALLHAEVAALRITRDVKNAEVDMLTADRDAQAEAVRVLAHVVRVAKTIPSTAGMEAVARGMTYSGQRIENLTEALVTFDADANPIAAAAVKG